MKLFEWVIIDRAGEEPVVILQGRIFAPDKGTAKEKIAKEHVDFEGSKVEVRVREF